MKTLILAITVTTLAVIAGCQQKKESTKNTLQYPETKKVDTVDSYFGTNVEDPYRWLEDDMSEETKAWVEAQNEVTFSYLDKIHYRNELKRRLEELLDYERISAPFDEGDFEYFYKNDGLQNHSVLYRRKTGEEETEIYLDPNRFSEDGTVATAGAGWASDYGTAEESEEMFRYLYNYSPYHALKPGTDYPATLITTADHDDRVVPAHSFKFAARLQEYHQGSDPVLIRIETKAGHGSVSLEQQIALTADKYAFAWYNMGFLPPLVRESM